MPLPTYSLYSKGESMTKADPIARAVQVFAPWIVKRPGHECQVLFPLSMLDELVEEAIKRSWDAIREGGEHE